MTSDAQSLAKTAGFELLGARLGGDVASALEAAVAGGAIFPASQDLLHIFRHALADAIRNIESHPLGRLFQAFMLKGPYEDRGEIPEGLVSERLSDTETAITIRFIHSHMVNCFKGAVTELLAVAACLRLLRQLQHNGEFPSAARLFVGDAVGVRRAKGAGVLKGADLHILIEGNRVGAASHVVVAGVAEVKSYIRSQERLRGQIERHLQRTRHGLCVGGFHYPAEKVVVGHGLDRHTVRIAVVPSAWKLPRSFRFEDTDQGRVLRVDAGEPPRDEDEVTQVGDREWRIALRWSKEALAESAYEMTFWYMGKIGEVVYAKGLPKGWEGMTPREAGRNAATMMLYYALLRCRTVQEQQRAVAVYNCYGFGYAIGMSYRNAEGAREMLWPEDLDEILSTGRTKNGCRLR
jgi:hypothetical protein